MGIVPLDITTSLDGFVAGPNDGVGHGLGLRGAERLHDWFFKGATVSGHNEWFRTSGRSTEVLDEAFETTGAIVAGRRTFDIAEGWGGSHPFRGVPVFVLTHRVPTRVPEGATPFTFITDGIESALKQAKAAGDKNVVVMGGANVAQQALEAGLLDEVQLHVAPVLLGDGIRLFEHLSEPIELETTTVIEAPGVTHLRFRVVNRR